MREDCWIFYGCIMKNRSIRQRYASKLCLLSKYCESFKFLIFFYNFAIHFKLNLNAMQKISRMLLIPLLMFSLFASAQTRKISGKVVGNNNEPVAGASISVKGSSAGASKVYPILWTEKRCC